MGATVLVVEDERKLREFVRSYLERAGLTVASTGSGASPQVILTVLGGGYRLGLRRDG